MNRIEEKEAYILLQCLWEDYTENFYNAESPDLQNDIDDVGIEVTQALLNMKSKCEKISNITKTNFYGKNKHALEELIFFNKDDLLTNEDQSKSCDICCIAKKRINEKLKKFNSTYKKFNENGLFLFIRNCQLSKEEIKNIYDYFFEESSRQSKNVSILFLATSDNFHYNKKNKIKEKEINEDMKLLLYNIL